MKKRVRKNLRRKYNLLAARILGPAYYNSEMDQEAADDAICDAIIEKWEKMDMKKFIWQALAVWGWVLAAVFFFGVLAAMA